MLVPGRLFLTRGSGRHREKLISWELALNDAGISCFNLVRVSSIIPPGCRLVGRETGLKALVPGQVVFAVLSDHATSEPGRLIAASIGLATPRDSSRHGYLSEHHSFGETAATAGNHAENVAAQMLSASLGLPPRENAAGDDGKRGWERCGEFAETTSIAQCATGDRGGLWTTVVAAAVLLP